MPSARHGGRRGRVASLLFVLVPLLLLLCFSSSLSVSAATPPATSTAAATTTALAATEAATAAAPPLTSASAVPADDGDGDDDEGPLASPASAAARTAAAAAGKAAGTAAGTAAEAAAGAAVGTAAGAATAATVATGPNAAASAAQRTGSAAVAAASAAAANGTSRAGSVLSDLANATANGAASLPFPSYSDPGPALPFNLGQFLDIQRQNFITRVVDNLLRMSGDAAAQPVKALPGPLVDQPERRLPPGQRWRLPPLSGEQQAAAEGAQERLGAAAEGAQERLGAAADGAQKRLGAAADDAQAAATRAATRLDLPAENAPPVLPGSSGAPNPFRNLTRRYNSSKARRSNFRRGPTNSSQTRFNSTSGTYYEERGLGGPLADAAAAASDVIDDAAPAGIATVPAGPDLPTLGFGGSGPLFIFYAGVADGLIQSGLLVPGVSKLSGFSGGALVSVLISAGVPPRRILDIYRESSLFCNGTLPDRWWQRPVWEAKAALRSYADECIKTARWPLDVVSDTISKTVPPEALANVSATTQVWASEVSPLFYYAQRSWPMAPYSSVQDLANKVAASSAVPCAITPETYREVDGRAYIDGGFTASTNQLCINATDASPCVTIAATYFGPHGWVPSTRPDSGGTCDESVMIPPVWGLQARPLVGYGPHWPLDTNRDRLTMRRHQCAVPEVLDLLVLHERHAVPPVGFPGWAINPGKRTPMPISVCEFKGLLFGKANQTTAIAIYDHGIAEAKAFAEEVYGKRRR